MVRCIISSLNICNIFVILYSQYWLMNFCINVYFNKYNITSTDRRDNSRQASLEDLPRAGQSMDKHTFLSKRFSCPARSV